MSRLIAPAIRSCIYAFLTLTTAAPAQAPNAFVRACEARRANGGDQRDPGAAQSLRARRLQGRDRLPEQRPPKELRDAPAVPGDDQVHVYPEFAHSKRAAFGAAQADASWDSHLAIPDCGDGRRRHHGPRRLPDGPRRQKSTKSKASPAARSFRQTASTAMLPAAMSSGSGRL